MLINKTNHFMSIHIDFNGTKYIKYQYSSLTWNYEDKLKMTEALVTFSTARCATSDFVLHDMRKRVTFDNNITLMGTLKKKCTYYCEVYSAEYFIIIKFAYVWGNTLYVCRPPTTFWVVEWRLPVTGKLPKMTKYHLIWMFLKPERHSEARNCLWIPFWNPRWWLTVSEK